MKKIHPSTTLGAVLNVGAICCIVSGSYIAAALLSLVAYFASIREVAKYTSRFQFISVLFSSLLLGFSLDLYNTGFPFFLFELFIAAFGSVGRMMYFCKFSYTGKSWFEPLLFFTALSLHLGNAIFNFNLPVFLVPLPVLAFEAILGWGIMNDKRQLLAKTIGGYRVQLNRPASDFELPDQDGLLTKLSDFKDKRHLLLIFVRGDWCPGCHMMLRTYEKNNKLFMQKNVMVMAIGPDPVGVNRQMVEKLGLDFKVLSDEKQKTAMVYGVQIKDYENNFAEKYEEGIPLPASFLIDKKGIVRYVSRPDKIGEFLNPSLIFPIVEQLN